jgi:hypothetical protein
MAKLYKTFAEIRGQVAAVRNQLAEELRRDLGTGLLRSRGVGFMTYDVFGEPIEPRPENKRWAEFSAREFDYVISFVETMHPEVAEIRACGGLDFSKTLQSFDFINGDSQLLVGEFAIPVWTSFEEDEERAKTKIYITRNSPSHVE